MTRTDVGYIVASMDGDMGLGHTGADLVAYWS